MYRRPDAWSTGDSLLVLGLVMVQSGEELWAASALTSFSSLALDGQTFTSVNLIPTYSIWLGTRPSIVAL